MKTTNSEMPCKVRKRRLSTASSSSFAHTSLAQLFMDKIDSPPHNEKCTNKSNCEEDETTMTLPKSGSDNLVNEVVEKSVTNFERSRDKSCSSHEEKTQPCNEIETVTKVQGQPSQKPTHGLNELKHSLTVSKHLLKLLTHILTVDSNHHDHNHPTTLSLATTLNHELNKARYNVNKLIQEQRWSDDHTNTHEPKYLQDKIRVAVKAVSRELETERKLRRQCERMNKRLGRELVNTKSVLAKAEAEKQATEILERFCEKMTRNIEEERVELEELRKETEKVRIEMEEEREMLRVADMLREERVQMKLIDAKYEYEDKYKQADILVHDLKELLGADNDIEHITPTVLSWYQSHYYNKDKKGKMENDENTLVEEIRDLSWFENMGDHVKDQTKCTQNEVIGRISDCIELDFELDMIKNHSEDSNLRSTLMKEYEDEMERYKMIKDLRDRIVSGGFDLSQDTIDFGSYM
ncbi:hypothetical protein QVD17_13171 [Tagetes erecta]|uniref:Uncharacterized protein n=1 Tax=Tagetes erecta TaxID=13708 RepID=A0AAD8KVS7_TARER|nr:hypothetical protein QVD17_13171 [Tagetes erecta]